MATVAAPTPVATTPKVKKATKASGAAKTKKVADHPKYSAMVKEALVTLKERGGSSRVAILKYITQKYKLAGEEKAINSHLKVALRAGVKSGLLNQSKGTGAAGSFKLGDKKEATKKPKAAKTAAAKKPKKPVGVKKPKMVKKAASPTKAAKPKVAKPKAAAKPAKAAKPTKAAVKPTKAAPTKAVKADKPKKITKAKSPKKTPKPKKATTTKKAPAAAKA